MILKAVLARGTTAGGMGATIKVVAAETGVVTPAFWGRKVVGWRVWRRVATPREAGTAAALAFKPPA
jgi:hypothetical protein